LVSATVAAKAATFAVRVPTACQSFVSASMARSPSGDGLGLRNDAPRAGGPRGAGGCQAAGAAGKEAALAMVRLLAGFAVFVEPATGSKEVRAEPFAAQAEGGNVRVVRAPWNGDWLDELLAFPNGRNDDQVDGTSGAFNKLAGAYSVVGAGDVRDALSNDIQPLGGK
jgi:hypothetical protein